MGSRESLVVSQEPGVGSRESLVVSQEPGVESRESLVVSHESDSEKYQVAYENTGKEKFEFKIFCSNKDLDGTVLANIKFDQWVRYSDNTEVWYASKNNWLSVLKKEIEKEKPDYLFIVGMYSRPFNFKPLLFCRGVKKIISVRGMLHPGALSQKSFKKKIYLSLWKLLGLHKKNIFHATDEKEREYIQRVFGIHAEIKVAANFPRVLSPIQLPEKTEGSLKLVSIALISPMKNILMVLEALESLVVSRESLVVSHELLVVNRESLVNSIEYNIYGPVKDKNYWEQCEALIKKLPENIRVIYHGDIRPDDIADALAQNHVFILPSKSENFGHAIYEALTAGRPVITSNHTPWNDLEKFNAGINVSTDHTGDLQKAIKQFAAMNQEQLNQWSDGSRNYALQAVDIEETRRQYKAMFG